MLVQYSHMSHFGKMLFSVVSIKEHNARFNSSLKLKREYFHEKLPKTIEQQQQILNKK